MSQLMTNLKQKQPDQIEKAKTLFERDDFKSQIKMALPRHMNPDRMLRVALTAILGNPKLIEVCNHSAGMASIAKAMLTASQLGLEVDGRQGHLVPFNDKKLGMVVQFIPGYQGLVDKAYNHPKVKSIWWNMVHERDQFNFVDGLERKLEHIKYDGTEDPGPLRYAYAVCEMDGGSRTFVCLNKREIAKARSCSRGADSNYSPWNTHEPAMWGKTAVRALCKQIPQSNELRDALTLDDSFESDDRPVAGVSTKPLFALTATAPPVEEDEIPMATETVKEPEKAEAKK